MQTEVSIKKTATDDEIQAADVLCSAGIAEIHTVHRT